MYLDLINEEVNGIKVDEDEEKEPTMIDVATHIGEEYTDESEIVIELHKKINGITNKKELLVPYNSINNNGLLRCIKVLKIEIDNKEYKNVLVGLSMNNISIDGIDCILNNKLLEDEQ